MRRVTTCWSQGSEDFKPAKLDFRESGYFQISTLHTGPRSSDQIHEGVEERLRGKMRRERQEGNTVVLQIFLRNFLNYRVPIRP